MKKRILSIVICLFLLVSLTACSGGGYTPSQKGYKSDVQFSSPLEDQDIVSNDKYTLKYIANTGSVTLVDNETGSLWEVCPTPKKPPQLNEFGLEIPKNDLIQSVLNVGYMDENINGGGNLSTTSFVGSVGKGHMVYKPIENGITIEYYFDEQKFMIPVDYVLKDDYLSISIDSTKILEDELRITYVSLTPFLCSVENDSSDSYLFMPSGSGALLGTASYNELGHMYDTYIYGDDVTKEELYTPYDEKSVRMPVYGYKNGDLGGFSIIDNSAETVLLQSTSGNISYGFSAVYPSFQLRGYTEHEARTFNNTYITNIFPQNMLEGTFSIRFYPLSGDKANYTAMADIYRNYLIDECGLKETDNEKAMSVSVVGGTKITKSFVGIPYTTVYPTTTVNQANTIITDLSKDIKDMAVKLKGFGSSGVDIGKIGGGFKLNSNIGSSSQLKKLANVCDEQNVDLYMDYNLVEFNSGGAGFSYSSDAAMNSGYVKSDQHSVDFAVRINDEKKPYRLLRPVQFNTAIEKSVKANNGWNISGISLDTLTSLSYSDYSDYNETVKYNAKYGFDKAVSNALKIAKNNKQKIMASEANAYAAIMADLVVDAPVTSFGCYATIEDVPFYSMVFKGYVPMTTESINLAASSQIAFLGAVEGGLGLNYTITNNWDNSLIDALYPYFYSTEYSSIKDDITSAYNGYINYFNSVKGATIVSNTIVDSGVHCTEFSNGVTVYVNYNDTACQTPAGEVPALGFLNVPAGGVE